MLPTRALRAARGTKPNITGFNMRDFKEAATKPVYDPWERAEAWRYTGQFTRYNRFKNALPGLGTATVLFAGYCLYEHFFLQDDHHHHHDHSDNGHGQEKSH